MADVKLTPSQQAVVGNRGGPLLVSAAAGSGKTKVLVERLLQYICQSLYNIDDFLVITYTNAAAAELRLKIAQAISQRLAQEPENKHLQRQMSRIYLAQISTVHAFCADLLRTYGHLLEIPGDFRMAEETEAQALRTKVLDQMLEQGYTQRDADFLTMADAFGYGRDDHRLADAVRMAYDAMRCRPDMEGWLRDMQQVMDLSQYDDVSQTPWGAYVMNGFSVFLNNQIQRMNQALTEMRHDPAVEKAYAKVFEENVRQMQQLLQCESWDAIYQNKITGFGRLGAVRNPLDVQQKERVAAVRKNCWDELKKWQNLFYAPSRELLRDLEELTPATGALLRFAGDFDRTYSQEKKRRKLLDFSDLEHMAIRLLTDRYTGKPTKIAQEISRRYVEIMVDEYQDSNQVQEVIFEAISRNGKNRFMVGDVKQSIYRFRLADPSLFLKKYETYPYAQAAQEDGPRKILLSENFRSRPEILDACNAVFRLVMRKTVGELDYGEAEALRPGRPFPALDHPAVELHCLTTSDEEETRDKQDLEADFVAARIHRMLLEGTQITDGDGTRTVRPGDITILMRSVANNAQAYLEALRRYGIPAVCNRGGSLLDTTEVQLLVAMLQVLDNPHQDVPLLAILASPVFGYAPETLAASRASNRTDDFYDLMLSQPETYESFLTPFQQLRKEAAWLPIHMLVDSIFYQTGLDSVFSAMADGVQRRKNLMAFRSAAVLFEANGIRSLTNFLAYLEELRAGGGQLPVPQGDGQDAVTIMSVHKSKGLEFPVVFLCDLSRQFNMQDLKEAILVDDQLAVGCNRIDHQQCVRYPTLAKKSIERKKRQEAISEELRILYVAMTRPKDMLVMTYYSKRLIKELETLNSQLTIPLSDDVCASVNNPGKWILLTALCRTEAGALLVPVGGNAVCQVSEIPWDIELHDLTGENAVEVDAAVSKPEQLGPAGEQTAQLLQFDYPYRSHSLLPSKITATQLKGRSVDQEAAEGAVELHRKAAYSFRTPEFLPQEQLTAAQRGTATHLFLQFADFKKCTTRSDVEEELHRMQLHAFLTPQQAEAVRVDQIITLFRSELGQWLLSAQEIQREFKFSILMDAGALNQDAAGEEILLQGVVDCFVIEPEGITIVDFKTDRISGNLQERAAYYTPQLEAYGKALERIYGLPIRQKLLYFFSAGKAIAVN